MENQKINAIQEIRDILAELKSNEARKEVLLCVIDRFGIKPTTPKIYDLKDNKEF